MSTLPCIDYRLDDARLAGVDQTTASSAGYSLSLVTIERLVKGGADLAKKYQVFVSSTFRDLVDERQDAIRNILDLQHIPAGMELFPASDVDQLSYIKKVIDECDYYLLIVGGRYGSMDADGISYTEREYDYAVETGKFVLAFVHDDPASIAVGKSDVDPNVAESLAFFRNKVMSGRLVRTWRSREGLEPLVLKALMHAFNDAPQVGWIRANAATSEEVLLQANAALTANAELRERIKKFETAKPFNVGPVAGLDEVVKIRYRYRLGSGYNEATAEVTWIEIAVGFGGVLDVSYSTSWTIDQAFAFSLKRRGSTRSGIDVNDVDAKIIRVQMEALGIISAQISKNAKGGYSEFLSLTAKGRGLFLSEMVVRPSAGEG